jgi:ketosteroid isomerase-like protein
MNNKYVLFFLMSTFWIDAIADHHGGQALQKAMTPKMAHELWESAFNEKNLDQLCVLYAENAVVHNGDEAPSVGSKAICEGLKELFLKGADKVSIETGYELRSDDLALLRSIWQMDGKDEEGNPTTMNGSGIEVVQRQADGSWLYVLDHPMGAAEIAAKTE